MHGIYRISEGGRISKRAVIGAMIATCAVAACGGSDAISADTRPLVLVAGATGGTGREVVRQALAQGYRVRVLVRDVPKARALFGDDVVYVTANVRDAATLPAAVAGADYVVSALGSNSRREPENKPEYVDFGGVKALAEAAKAADVKQFVLVSSMGVTDPNHMLNRILDDIMTWKLRGEDALRASGVRYTIVRPGGLKDDAGGKAGIRVMQGDPQNVTGQIPRADVAAVCVAALGRKDAYGKTFEILSDPKSSRPDWDRFFATLRRDER